MLIQAINCYNNPNFSAKNALKRITNSMGRNPSTGKGIKSSKDVRLPQNRKDTVKNASTKSSK